MSPLVLALVLGASWELLEKTDGLELYQRELEGERTVELKVVAASPKSPQALCDAAFGTAELDKNEPDITTRKLLREEPGSRVTYEQISAPVVSDRDYAVRATKEPLPNGGCRMRFEAANALAPKVPEGYVRIEKLKGSWTFEPAPDGNTVCTYVIHTDPGGAIPVLFVEGPRKKTAKRWMKLVIARARDERADAGR